VKAMVQDRYGPPLEVLSLRELEPPRLAEGEVLVRVVAAGAHVGDWHICVGEPYLVRAMGFGLRAPSPAVRGTELAGEVAEVAAGVTDWRVGDEVFGFGVGTFAELAVAKATKLAPKPAGLTFEEAAALPVSGTTALQALRVGSGVRPDARVLVLGAGGAVGSFAVQLAKAAGAEVTGVCSTAKVELVRSLGAVQVVDYTRGDVGPEAGPFDLVIDTGGNRPVSRMRRLLTQRGTLVVVGGEGGGRWLGPAGRLLAVALVNSTARQTLHGLMARETRDDLLALAEHVESEEMRPSIGRTVALAEAAQALHALGDGRGRGKSVVRVVPGAD
jgi:NADPH:quinone reductase-like Zn-dependent oxidoreductase